MAELPIDSFGCRNSKIYSFLPSLTVLNCLPNEKSLTQIKGFPERLCPLVSKYFDLAITIDLVDRCR